MPKSIEAEVEIDATPSRVWAVLSDVSRYPEWNPFVRRWDGELRVGNRVSIGLQAPGGRVYGFRPTLRVVDHEREIRWLGKLGPGGFFDGEHSLRLEPVETARTRFVQSERFSGILVPFLRGTVAGAAAGFTAMNAALKSRVEDRRAGTEAASAVG
jgi:hypothetical protein